MKSHEQTGESPEQSNEEPIKNKQEEASEKLESPESYDEKKWEELKNTEGAAVAIRKGKKIGVPQEKIDRFAEEIITHKITKQDYNFIYRFRKYNEIGTKEDIETAGKNGYKLLLEIGDYESAVSLAEDFYGKGSNEWKRANEANEKKKDEAKKKRKKKEEKREEEDQRLEVSISKDATFADLFKSIDTIENDEGFEKLHFEEELLRNFNEKIMEEVLSFRDTATTTKVLDFFKDHGYSQSDISVFLPIKFKREKK